MDEKRTDFTLPAWEGPAILLMDLDAFFASVPSSHPWSSWTIPVGAASR